MNTPPRAASLARGSSPVSMHSADAQEAILTPRSKIRALMASVDDSDDSDEVQTRPIRRLIQNSSAAETRDASPPTKDDSEDDQEDDDNDDDEDVLPLPRGRLAARMQDAKQTHQSDDEKENGAESAYARLKRQLQARQLQASESKPKDDATESSSTHDSEGSPRLQLMKRVLFQKRKPATARPAQQHSAAGLDGEENFATQTSQASDPLTDRHLDANTDSDDPVTARQGDDFKARVEAKRAERRAREAEEEVSLAKRRERMQQSSDKLKEMLAEDGNADGEDIAGGKKLSSQNKPTRKASKKAIEAMNRETQRMSRNMQLAHAATTRKKITKESLFAKFNFRQSVASVPTEHTPSSSLPGTPRPTSDAEQDHQTPPTSPASPSISIGNLNKDIVEETRLKSLPVVASDANQDLATSVTELPDLDELLTGGDPDPLPEAQEDPFPLLRQHTPPKLSAKARGKQKADPTLPLEAYKSPEPERKKSSRIHNFRVKLPSTRQALLSDSESDLEIVPQRPMFAKFDEILAKAPQARNDSNQRTKFRALAQPRSPSKQDRRSTKKSVPVTQMQANLQRKARQQIAAERAERLADLRARGVLIQTSEERERDQVINEDLLEKARKEVEELTKREKSERKKGDQDGEAGNVMEIEESDDESYVGSGSDDEFGQDVEGERDGEEEEDGDIEMSGSDDESGGVKLNEDGLIDNEAAEHDNEEEESSEPDADMQQEEAGDESEAELTHHPVTSRRNRKQRVLDDEDDEETIVEDGWEAQPVLAVASTGNPSTPVIVNPFANGGIAKPLGAAPMGLSQAFAATMDDSQVNDDEATQYSSAVVVAMPEPNLPVVDRESLLHESNRIELASMEVPLPLLPQTQYNTQHTTLTQDFEMPEPTQDQGLVATSPIVQRFASIPPSTVDTLPVSNPQPAEFVNPNLRRRGRLLRRGDLGRVADDEEAEDDGLQNAIAESPVPAKNAFAAMKKAEMRRQRIEEFNKKKSAAKDVVDEQAEESEDEYAGLGGASDDESGGEMDEEVKKMLDDETQVEPNESQLAAFHANKERISDEKAIEKLYKDISNGMLRRKRGGGDFDDLSDSDDEAERRQRMKRAEFARMRRALLADENVGKIAENPKKAAFLKALEDRDDDDGNDGGEFDFESLDQPEKSTTPLVREDSIQEVPNSQPELDSSELDAERASEKRKRPLEETDPNARLPPAMRRTRPDNLFASRKHISKAEVNESISFLLEDSRGGEILVPATPSSDIKDDAADARKNSQREDSEASEDVEKRNVVDRLSLKRQESAQSNASSGGRVAFFTKGRDEQGFRVPSLLKRATTLSAGGDVTFVTERTAAGNSRKEGEVKRGGTKKSSVAYFAREVERRKGVEKIEKRRDVQRRKAIETRRGLLKGLGGGKFE